MNYCVLIYIHNWDLMKSVVVMAAHHCYLFVMKAMVYSHAVMTALIVMLPSIFFVVGVSLQFHRSLFISETLSLYVIFLLHMNCMLVSQ